MRIVVALACLIATMGCAKQEKAANKALPQTPPRSLEAFGEIGASMSLADVEHRFGPPDTNAGSGIYIYVYRLPDGSHVSIGASDPNKILYVNHGTNRLFERPSSQ